MRWLVPHLFARGPCLARALPLLALALLPLFAIRPAQAGDAWERLPDGRVVIEIYGRRLAFPVDLPPGSVMFEHGQRPHPTRPGGWEPRVASLQEVIADRTAAERWWTGSDPTMPVGVTLSTRFVAAILFEGEDAVDRSAIRLGPGFDIWVYQEPGRTACRSLDPTYHRIDIQACDYFLERSRDTAAEDRNGFIVEEPSFLRGLHSVFHVFPERERRAPPGDAALIRCLEYPGAFACRNGSGLRRGYFLHPGIFLRYQYWTRKTDRPDMRRIDNAFREAAQAFLIQPPDADGGQR